MRVSASKTEATEQKARPSRLLGESRKAAIASLLRSAGSVTITDIGRRFGVSPMTARRDLSELERRGLAQRTHGGAVLPTVKAHADSFAMRVEAETEAEIALADEAISMLAPHQSVFLDSSVSGYFVARGIVARGLPVTLITNSEPVMELVASAGSPSVELIGIGGTLRPLTRSFVGPPAIQMLVGHFADRCFFSVKGVTTDGTMTDGDALEAEVKRTMLANAGAALLLLDCTQLPGRGLSVVGSIRQLDAVVAHGLTDDHFTRLQASGTLVHRV